MLDFIKKYWLAFIGNLLIWGVPLITVFTLYFEQSLSQYKFEITGILVLVIVLVVYNKAIKQKIRDGKLASKIKSVDNKSHPVWRILQMFIYGVEIGIAYLFVGIMSEIGVALQYYITIIAIAAAVGYVCLIIDDSRTIERE